VQAIQKLWAGLTTPPDLYHAGSDGPACADELLARDGFQWLPLK
jgi:glucose-6-phosphate 1-dehydrogenase